MEEEWYKKSKEADVTHRIPFFCKIGQVEAYIFVDVEPDPHGDGKGTHAHFHAVPHCPKTKIVDYPEPDRCQANDETCPFWEPLGGYERDSITRKWVYAQQFLHYASFIEVYGMQLINISLKSKGFKLIRELPDLKWADIIEFLCTLEVIGTDVYSELNNIRKKRNKLTHRPDEYKGFKEKELFELMIKTQKLANLLYGKSKQ